MASGVNPLSSSSGTDTGSSTTSAATTAKGYEQTFLTLLVSQLQNQDPLNPTDSTQFVTQLAQFSQLEQVIAIRQDIEGSTSTSTSTGSGTSSTNGTSS